MTTVVVADDQPVIRDGFADVLDSAPDITVLGRASNGQELVHLVRTLKPDVAVVDIRMPVMDGITATSHVSSHCKVLMLTTFDLHDYVLTSLRAGARGFLLKDVPAPRLIDAVRTVAEGSLVLGPSITDQLVRDLTQNSSCPKRNLPSTGLTSREGEVLGLVETGMSNAEIAAHLTIGQGDRQEPCLGNPPKVGPARPRTSRRLRPPRGPRRTRIDQPRRSTKPAREPSRTPKTAC